MLEENAAGGVAPEQIDDAAFQKGVNPDSSGGRTYRDAKIITPYNESDYAGQQITVSLGKNKFSTDWKPQTIPLSGLMHQLTKHEVGPKDGLAIVFADMVRGRRLKKTIKTCTAIGLDIDTGTPGGVVDKAIAKLGSLAIRYSTHSHNKRSSDVLKDKLLRYRPENNEITSELIQDYLLEKQFWDESVVETIEFIEEDHTEQGIVCRFSHKEMPKHRIVIPLLEPFVIANEGRTQQEAWSKWAKVPEALAAKLGVPFDRSCTDPSRLFYLPRHGKGRDFEISLFGGPLLDINTLSVANAFDDVAQEFARGGAGRSKSVTPEGMALGKWWKTTAHGFQVMDVIEQFAPDMVRSKATNGFNICCPFDEDHSNAGDSSDTACFAVNAADGGNEFLIVKCQHESCRDKTALDMLGRMVKEGWFDRAVLDDPAFNVAEAEDGASESYGVPPEIDNEIVALCKPPNPSKIALVISCIARSNATETQCGIWLAQIVERTGAKLRALQNDLKAERQRAKYNASLNSIDGKNLDQLLAAETEGQFSLPHTDYGEFHLGMTQGVVWLYREVEEGRGEAYCTPFYVRGEAHYDGGRRALRVVVRSSPGVWANVDIEAAWLAQPSGSEVMAALMNAGLKLRPKGRAYILELLSSLELPATRIVERGGWYGDKFVMPTGTVIPADTGIELSNKAKVKCVARAGAFEVWQEEVNWLYTHPHGVRFQLAGLIPQAGCLANLLEDETLTFFFNGPSSHGKSECQELAVSQCGDGGLKRGLFFTAKATDNAVEAPLEVGSGTVCAFDEVRHMKPQALHDLIFMAQSGMGKIRSTRDSEIRKTRNWSGGAVILSDEMSLGERLASGNVKMAAGMTVRVASIDFFDSHMFTEDEFRRITRLKNNFGWGGPAFVSALLDLGYVADPKRLVDRLDAIVTELVGATQADRQMKLRAASIPAYVRLAGEIAKEAGLVPPRFDAAGMGQWVWNQMLTSDTAPQSAGAKGLDILRASLVSRKGHDIVDYQFRDRAFKEAVGYHNALFSGQKVFVILASKLADLSGGSAMKKAMLDVLEAEGALVRSGKGERTWNSFPGLAKTQYIVLRADGIEQAVEYEAVVVLAEEFDALVSAAVLDLLQHMGKREELRSSGVVS